MFESTRSQITEIRDDLLRYANILSNELKARDPLVDTRSASKILAIQQNYKNKPSEYFYLQYKDCSVCISHGRIHFNSDTLSNVSRKDKTYHINIFGFCPKETFPESYTNRVTCKMNFYNYGSFSDFDTALIYFHRCVNELFSPDKENYNVLLPSVSD